MAPLTAGHDLALAVTQNCMNKIAAIIYHAGIVPTVFEGDLAPVSAAAGCLSSIPLIGPLLARIFKPGNYRFRAELNQAVFDLSSGQIRITGGAAVSILLNGVEQASIAFDLALPITVSLVSPGQQPAQPDEPQVDVVVGQPDVTPHVTGLPSGLAWVLGQVGDVVATAFVDHVLNIPAFPAFYRADGYGVVLESLAITSDQLVIQTDLEWPGRPVPVGPVPVRPIPVGPASAGPVPFPIPVPPISVAPVMTKVPFTLRRPHRLSVAPAAAAVQPADNPTPMAHYQPLPPIVRPGDITWPHHGPEYDIALALNQKPVQDVLNEKFPFSFSKTLADPVGRVDFTLDASFQLLDDAVDKIKMGAGISGQNSRSAVIECDGQAAFNIEVALLEQADGVKGQVAVAAVDVQQAKCKNTNLGLEVSAAHLADWLADQANLKQAINDQLTQRFGEPLIPLTFTIFQQTIYDSNLSVSIDLSNVVIVQGELQVWIAINEGTAPTWHWPLGH